MDAPVARNNVSKEPWENKEAIRKYMDCLVLGIYSWERDHLSLESFISPLGCIKVRMKAEEKLFKQKMNKTVGIIDVFARE